MSEERPVYVGTMVDGEVVGVALLDTPKKKPKAVDGDDCTWDWWQGMAVPEYDTRTSHDLLTARIAELEARLATLEEIVCGPVGD